MWQRIGRMLWKEFVVEYRSWQSVQITGMFVVITLTNFGIAFGGRPLAADIQAALLWLALFFAAVIGLDKSFLREQSQGTLYSLYLYSQAQVVFVGKCLYNCMLLNFLTVMLVPLYIVFLNVDVHSPVWLVAVLLSGNIGLSVVCSLVAALAARAGGRSGLSAVLAFPLLVPLFMLLIELTAGALEGAAFSLHDLLPVLAYDVAISGVGSVLFDFIWED